MVKVEALGFCKAVVITFWFTCCASVGAADTDGEAKFGIGFKPASRLDLLKVSARVVPASPVQPNQEAIGVSLVGSGGRYFEQTLPAGSLVATGKGDQWRFKADRDGSSTIYRLILRERLNTQTNRLEYRIKLTAESDLAAADPDRNAIRSEAELRTMTLQIVIGDDIFALTSAWERASNGWSLKEDRFPRATLPIPSSCDGVYVHDADLASWNDEIEQGRSSTFTLRFERSNGGSVNGYTARVAQAKHQFPFGATIPFLAFTPGADELKARCLAQADDLWNWVVDESRMKWIPTEPTAGAIDFGSSNQIVQWAQDHDKTLRHHTIFWSNPAQNPSWLDSLDANAFRQALLDRVDHFTAARCPAGASCVLPDPTLITSIDVINEMIFWKYYRDKLTEADFSGIVREIYDRVRENLPAAKLYVNEQPDHLCVFGDLCEGLDLDEAFEFVTTSYIQFVQQLRSDGVVFDGLALQSHFADPSLASPPGDATPAEIVAAYRQAMETASSALGMPFLVSELDYATNDGCERADFLNRFYHMAFASGFVEAIVYWGWVLEPQKALVDGECELNPAGRVVRYLIHEKWKTRLDHEQIGTGSLSARLFFGDYEVEVFDASGQLVATETVALHTDSERIVDVAIP